MNSIIIISLFWIVILVHNSSIARNYLLHMKLPKGWKYKDCSTFNQYYHNLMWLVRYDAVYLKWLKSFCCISLQDKDTKLQLFHKQNNLQFNIRTGNGLTWYEGNTSWCRYCVMYVGKETGLAHVMWWSIETLHEEKCCFLYYSCNEKALISGKYI